MSTAVRVRSYPLDAVRGSERWKLEALQSRLAAATADCASAGERHGISIDALRSAATAATATTGSVIDPVCAVRHLRYVDALRSTVVAARRAVETADAVRDHLRLAVGAQRVRLESIERHRQAFQRDESLEAERLQGIEDEQAWTARSAWRTPSASNPERPSAARVLMPEEGRP